MPCQACTLGGGSAILITRGAKRSVYRGACTHRIHRRHCSLAACHRRHRLDRQLVLLHPSRPQPAAAARASQRRQGRSLAGPRRRLLSHDEVSGGAGATARPSDLVQMGSVHDLALGVRAAGARLLSRRRSVPDRQVGARSHRDAGGGHRLSEPRGFLARLRGTLPLAARPARGRAGARRLCVSRRADLRLHARVQRTRRLHPDRRADRHHHGGQRLRHHHSLPEEIRRRASCRQGARSVLGPDRQAALGP